MTDDLVEQLKSAYRKFKTYTYYDNYGAINRAKIADFEANSDSLDDFFEKLAMKLLDDKEWKNLLKDPIVDILCYPKPRKSDPPVLGNIPDNINEIEKLNYFIDLDIETHILGTLWILRSGWVLDHRLNENIHGNRINEDVLSKIISCERENSKYSEPTPFLFEPYFKRYQVWRDEGLDSVEKLLNKKENAIMLSLDFKEYYYTSTIDFKKLKQDIKNAKQKLLNDSLKKVSEFDKKLDEFLTNFIEKIFKTYTERYFTREYYEKEVAEDKRLPLIPLGFLPSLIISNWNLQAFDQTIHDLVNPEYYGRYVDDVLIVFKSYPESESFSDENFNITKEEILEKYLTTNRPNPSHNILRCINNEKKDNNGDENENGDKENKKKCKEYGINNLCEKKSIYKEDTLFNKSNYENLRIQSGKLKLFIFKHEYSRALIENFKKEIYRNSSEFRLMHEVERSYVDIGKNIFSIQYADSINKISDIESIELNKFELSKALSWLIRSSIYETKGLSKKNRENIIHAFSGSKKIDFMILWEKLMEFLFIQKDYRTLEEEIEKIIKKISKLEVKTNDESTYKYNGDDEYLLKKSLKNFLYLTYARVSSLKKINDPHLRKIDDSFPNYLKIEDMRKNFVLSYLYKTSLMKDPLFLINDVPDNFLSSDYDLINFLSNEYDDSVNPDFSTLDKKDIYNYYPCYVQFHEATIHIINKSLFWNDMTQLNINEYLFHSKKLYNLINGFDEENGNKQEESKENSFKKEKNLFYRNTCIAAYNCDNSKCKFIRDYDKYIKEDKCSARVHVIKTGSKDKSKVKIGLINTKLENELLQKALVGNPNRSPKRLDKIAAIINEAVKKKVELLVMPEMYMPYEWIPGILDISRTHNMAMVFGIEPIIHGEHVGNYIGIALPSETENKQNCTLIMRLKNSYSPEELREYRKHNLKPKKNGLKLNKTKSANKLSDLHKTKELKKLPKYEYVLCIWNDIYFAPYYCYEIANIDHRSLFKSCCDMVIVSEYNKDTAYFTAIAESLSRDLFCYCIKVNSSEFGGTCILQPSKRENKYLIKLKGGIKDYVVTHDLDINKLRNHQVLNYESPIKDTDLKPKPPGFDIDKVRRRMKLPPRCNEKKNGVS
ncbi:MAG: hypothetical protein HZC47_04270 [Methanobacterium sp.]|uniref:hypothetical protein n=1 Tax=Methanobacterium sp. TaxID=2164 RepID=UPI003D64F7D8|nr:hypothetical protein [Methanobacterium sp.]